ncbi:MAG: PEGA domain-containing protein [Planctomycetota bacterium]|nr:MAG: PEGA domain-containing protein [Planctomycetota bacterium]
MEEPICTKLWKISLLLPPLLLGCVERILILRSDPPGAEAYLDGKRIGKTPLFLEFTHYGGREIILKKNGYQLLVKNIQLQPPIYEIFPLDFVFEILLPLSLQDIHTYHFKLEKLPPVQEKKIEKLWQRASQFSPDLK